MAGISITCVDICSSGSAATALFDLTPASDKSFFIATDKAGKFGFPGTIPPSIDGIDAAVNNFHFLLPAGASSTSFTEAAPISSPTLGSLLSLIKNLILTKTIFSNHHFQQISALQTK
jgi:hypothetical protein